MTPYLKFRDRAQSLAVVAALLFGFAAVLGVGGRAVDVEADQGRSFAQRGLSSYANGDRASAVLSLERAELLAPRTAAVRAALSKLDVDESPSRVASAVGWITPREWAWLTSTFGWVAGLCFAWVIVKKGPTPLARRVATASGVAFLLATGGFAESNRDARALAVVAGPTGLLVAPYDGAGATADLSAGMVVREGARYGRFIEVRDRSDARGWVTSDALRSVVDAPI